MPSLLRVCSRSWQPAQLAQYLLSLVCFLLPSLLATEAHAFPVYPELLPNRAYAFSANYGVDRPCITCHNNPDGGQGCFDLKPPATNTAPCFNPFGAAFKANGKVWNATLALADADGDGFTNGQELQDPLGTWVKSTDPPEPGNKAYVTRPGFPDDNPGLAGHDADGDRYCWFGRDLNMDGDCGDNGENTDARDCDDNSAQTNSGAVELCTDTQDNNCDGLDTVADPVCADVVDNDRDGYCETGRDLNHDRDCLDSGEASSINDCDDARSNVYFDAPENCVDGVDNDCDGKVDTDDAECDPHDDDGDGYCPLGQVIGDNDHDCSDPGEQLDVSDCDDENPAVSPGATEVCTDSLDNDCDGQPDFTDSSCLHLVDADGDGYCPTGQDLNKDGNCAGAGEDNGKNDCDDTLPTRNPGKAEVCFESLDADCDGKASIQDPDCVRYVDLDGDGYCLAGQDINKNGSCIDDKLDVAIVEYAITNLMDCDDTSAIAFPRNSNAEALSGTGCFDGVDTDCDGLVDGADKDCSPYKDSDGDGTCRLGTDLSDPPDGDCTDPGETSESELDCNDGDAASGPSVQENCIDNVDNNCDGKVDEKDADCVSDKDADADGFCPRGTDLNGDGNCQGTGENRGNDCDDEDPSINSGALEDTVRICKDARDNDCDGKADRSSPSCAVFIDNDQDGFCEQGRDNNFNQTCLDAGEQTSARDCDDTTKAAFPGRREVCDDGLDNDCNGKSDALDVSVCTCTSNDQCNTGDPCSMGVCHASHCVAEPICHDAGLTPGGHDDAGVGMEPDPGMAGGPDAGAEQPVHAPKPPSCSSGTSADGHSAVWLAGLALGLTAFLRRRRSRG